MCGVSTTDAAVTAGVVGVSVDENSVGGPAGCNAASLLQTLHFQFDFKNGPSATSFRKSDLLNVQPDAFATGIIRDF